MGFRIIIIFLIDIYKYNITCSFMKLKDILTKVKNSANNQTVWSPKKRVLKDIDISEEEILNIKLDKLIRKGGFD